MSMTFNAHQLERAALLVVVGEDGIYEWSSTKNDEEVAAFLRSLAAEIEARTKAPRDAEAGQ